MSARSFFKTRAGTLEGIGTALLTGGLVGIAFRPEPALGWLVWIALVPLLHAIDRAATARHALGFGALAGLVACLMSTAPLLSAQYWGGWELLSPAESAERRWHVAALMYGLWILYAGFWCGGVFWGLFAAVLKRLGGPRSPYALAIAPAAWILIAEWLRVKLSWGFHWVLLGNAAAGELPVMQLASLGGVWLIGALVVTVNVCVYVFIFDTRRGRVLGRIGVTMALAAALIGWGAWRVTYWESGDPAELEAGVIQYHERSLTLESDFSRIGFDKNYMALSRQVLQRFPRELALLALPESVAVGALTREGTRPSNLRDKPIFSPEQWRSALSDVIGQSRALLVLGSDLVVQGKQYNALTAWTSDGLVGDYRKRALVPFGEYRPFSGLPGVAGATTYTPGRGPQLIRHGDMVIGGFICQEVAFPDLIRNSVRAGANILISGGNDGVFRHPAVAQKHARMARLRAVESGRYIIRAMRTGVSALISPTGKVLSSAAPYERSFIKHSVDVSDITTPYVRFGKWVVWLSMLTIAISGAVMVRRGGLCGHESVRSLAGELVHRSTVHSRQSDPAEACT